MTVAGEGERGQAVEAPGDVRHPTGREPELLGLPCIREEIADTRAVGGHLADEDAQLHGGSFARPGQSSLEWPLEP